MKRIKQWFNNHTRAGGASETRIKVLDLTGRKPKKLQPTQAYSRLYYDKKLKPAIADAWAKHILDMPADKLKRPNLRFRNKVIKEMWLEEPEHVQEEVEKYREELSIEEEEEDLDGTEADHDIDAGKQQRRSKASAYQR
jgi:hypothetical protein